MCLRSYSKAKFLICLSFPVIESRLFTMAMEFWDEYSNNVIVIDVIERDSNVQLWLTQTLRGIV